MTERREQDQELRPFQMLTLNGSVVVAMAPFMVSRLLKHLPPIEEFDQKDSLMFSFIKGLRRNRYMAQSHFADDDGDDGSRRAVDDGRYTDSDHDVDFGDDDEEVGGPYGRMRKTGS